MPNVLNDAERKKKALGFNSRNSQDDSERAFLTILIVLLAPIHVPVAPEMQAQKTNPERFKLINDAMMLEMIPITMRRPKI